MNPRLMTTTRGVAFTAAAALALAACASDDVSEDSRSEAEAPIIEQTEETDTETNTETEAADSGSTDRVSTSLTLAQVSLREVDLDDEREEFTQFCFASPINDVGSAGSFALAGFDSKNSTQATSAVLDEEDANCAVVGFEPDTDVRSYSLGAVETGAVTARDGEVNVRDSAGLSGIGDEGEARRGATTAPELQRVTIDPSLDQATYIFDENELTEGSGGAEGFGFYPQDGQPRTAEEVVSVEDNRVVVQFEEGVLGDARRFFVQPGAVTDEQGTENTLDASGFRTAAPEVVQVSSISESEYDFRFDEAVEGEQAERFFLYTADAESLSGTTVTRPSPETVRVTFPEAMDISESIARAAVADDAVQGLGSGSGSTISTAVIAGGQGNQGLTSGPDLIAVDLDADTGRATFTFDATLTEDSSDAGGFALVTDSGDVVEAREIVNVTGGEVTGNTVIVLFDETTGQAAVLASVDSGAVEDQQGNPNPVATVEVG
jgi:hypothetical protein